MEDAGKEPRRIPALKVHQWLREWDAVPFDAENRRRRPFPYYYLFSLPASDLRALSGIHRREAHGPRSQDLGIQRIHEAARSEAIREFVKYGYPWCELSPARRRSDEFSHLRKPGWLPTAIVVNILTPENERNGRGVATRDLLHVVEADGSTMLELPRSFHSSTWNPTGAHPIEVIDGQHRLWAFDKNEALARQFELPVVAYQGLDISWQAYLFWTINIKPKRINASLAFDLFPLLRTEDWLEGFGLPIYRETRAQELTEALWSNPHSPWHFRINMLGEAGVGGVTQAAWIRSLVSSFMRRYDRRSNLGGLFGAPLGDHGNVLDWNRPQQAAFLIDLWDRLSDAVRSTKSTWADQLREAEDHERGIDPAFAGRYSLLNTDQGVRGVLLLANDLCFIRAADLKLAEWTADGSTSAVDEDAVSDALATLEGQPAHVFLGALADALATFDWRASSYPGLSQDERTQKAAFRGSGGYRELRLQLLEHLARGSGAVTAAARIAVAALKK